MRYRLGLTIVFLLMSFLSTGQDISLFQQFNGRYDYTAIGNTLNQAENNLDGSFCEILHSSQATLNIDPTQNIIAAYLYWAGSGEADTEVHLNGTPIISDIDYSVSFNTGTNELVYFSCFSDVTDFVIAQGNTTYELSELDISVALLNPGYCGNRTNFAGWSLYVIYEEATLPLNQISLFQGLEIINTNVTEKVIELENINVLDNNGAKIGFLAWEGDNALNFGESLSINDNILSSPPLNLSDNAFNGTNSFTNSDTFYNADLDVYNIQDNIAIGDTSATIKLTTGGLDENGNFRADLIILNNIITVLNSQLPDATASIDNSITDCNSNSVALDYTIYNLNSTASLPAGTPIAFYADGILIGQSATLADIVIGGSEANSITLAIPNTLGDSFSINLFVDDNGTGSGIVSETNESNNLAIQAIVFETSEPIISLSNLLDCDLGLNTAVFDLTEILQDVSTEFDITSAQFYTDLSDAENQENEILNPSNFINTIHPQTIFIRILSTPCYQLFQFDLMVENCPPIVPDGFSPNDDGFNDWFNIQGLYDVFDQHELLIYNRFGTLIFKGNNNLKWQGKSNRGINDIGKLLPVGTYFYVLHLNDPNYNPMTGWVYLNY